MTWTRLAAVLGFVGVALGAFGAHGLEDVASAEELAWWRTASLYHLLHVAPLLVLDALPRRGPAVAWAGRSFVAGIVVFAGSLYAMGLGGPRVLGAVTPVGGVLLLAGWVLLALSAGRAR